MTELLVNSTLANKKNRQRSVEPDPVDYNDFLNLLYDDLEFVLSRLTRFRKYYYAGMIENSQNGENLINTTICEMLFSRGWLAEHETFVNGHGDIVVTLPYTDYLWLGEGKINNNNTHIYHGLKQLLYRYSTGLDNQTDGGLIIYIAKDGKSQPEILELWKSYFTNKKETLPEDSKEMPYSPILRFESCPKNSLAFYTYHKHPSTEKEFCVRHMALELRFHPKD